MHQPPASAMKLTRAEALQVLELTASFRAIMLELHSETTVTDETRPKPGLSNMKQSCPGLCGPCFQPGHPPIEPHVLLCHAEGGCRAANRCETSIHAAGANLVCHLRLALSLCAAMKFSVKSSIEHVSPFALT